MPRSGLGGVGRTAIVAGLVAALVAALGLAVGAHRARADCLPPIINCPPPPPPPTPTGADATGSSGRATGFRTAAVSGTLDTGGAQTTYSWIAEDHANHAPEIKTTPVTLPAGQGSVTVSGQLTGLQPGTDYDLALLASNNYGSSNHWTYNALSTPQRVRITVHTNASRSVRIGDSKLQVWAHLAGEFSRYEPVQLYVAPAPFHHWYLANNFGGRPGRYDNARTALCLDQYILYLNCRWTMQNFKLRIRDGSAYSKPLLEYAEPGISSSSVRENNGYSPWIDVRISAYVHYVHHDFHTQPVYFYEGRSRRGPFRLRAVGHFRLRDNTKSGIEWGSAELVASARLNMRFTGYTYECFRHQLLPDMGKPFLAKWCGRRTLK